MDSYKYKDDFVSTFMKTHNNILRSTGLENIHQKIFKFLQNPSRTYHYLYFMRPKLIKHLKTLVLSIMVFAITLMILRVHHNKQRIAPIIIEFDETTDHPETVLACTQEHRREVMKETCKMAKEGGLQLGIRDDNNVKILVADDERKILYCVLPKTGTKSWLHYLVTLADKVKPGHWHFRKTEFMNKAGLDYRRNVPVHEIATKYKHYFKFIVARHPLQRLASAYYEAILKAERYTKQDGSAPNFTEFNQRLEGDLAPQLHWSLYQDECQVCKVKYDFIIKTETIDEDSNRLNEAIGSDVNLTVRHTNFLYEDKAQNDVFKYDHMFQDVMNDNPEAMKAALRVYHMDMRTMGYQWDWENQRSKCDNDNGIGGFCC